MSIPRAIVEHGRKLRARVRGLEIFEEGPAGRFVLDIHRHKKLKRLWSREVQAPSHTRPSAQLRVVCWPHTDGRLHPPQLRQTGLRKPYSPSCRHEVRKQQRSFCEGADEMLVCGRSTPAQKTVLSRRYTRQAHESDGNDLPSNREFDAREPELRVRSDKRDFLERRRWP